MLRGFFKWIKNYLSILNAVNLDREYARGGLWNNSKIARVIIRTGLHARRAYAAYTRDDKTNKSRFARVSMLVYLKI